VYAGGTELLLAMKENLLAPEYLVDVKRLALGNVSVSPAGELRIGATSTHREIEAWALSGGEDWRALAELEAAVANIRVRNQGTIGGNLCFAEPHADPGTLLSAWDASVELAAVDGRRTLPIGEFLRDEFVTALEDSEIMTAIVVPPRPPRSASAYRRFAFLERPTVGVAALVALEPDGNTVADARIAVGAVGPRPERVTGAERGLIGAEVAGASWAQASARAAQEAAQECSVSADAHGSEEYKRHLVDVHVRRALETCRARLAPATTNGKAR
jgi:carbon-monoxide dehydrogenase medium subunit